jgi:glycosyltransferase involved in cell wall biosynthesis
VRRPRICIVGLEDYGLLSGETTTNYVGGETVQHVLLARAWRDLGVDVSVIVYDHGQPRINEIDGIRTIAAFKSDAGLPGLRFVHPRITRMLDAMREADADIYYQSLSSVYTGVTAWFCRQHRKHFVFRIASDAYCIPGQQLIRFWRDRKIYEYGLKRADLIVAQTEYQQRLLRIHYELDSQIASLVVEPPKSKQPVQRDIDVLWVSNFRDVKRPELAIELARRSPQLRVTVVGGGPEKQQTQMLRAAAELPNLHYAGPVAYDAVGAYFDRAKVFVNTSTVEGFPNTFVQAWIRGVPVVTFFDPDGLVAKRGLGVAVSTFDEMVATVSDLATDDRRRQGLGTVAAVFAADTFSMHAVARRYLSLFASRFGGAVAATQAQAVIS